MGTAALQHVLADAGAGDVMYDVATQTSFPGWGHQIVNGATTVWETWGGEVDRSLNMKLLASATKFLYKDVAGIAPTAPGWAAIRVKPVVTHRLEHARARVHTVRGDAAVAWSRHGSEVRIEVEVPSTSRAEVVLPDGRVRKVGGGSHRFVAALGPRENRYSTR
jgi:alpha-L-rhamnosidase